MTQSEKGEVLAAARPPGGSAMHDNDNSPRGHTEDRKVGLRPGFFSVAPPTGPSSYSETTNEPDLPTLACFFLFFFNWDWAGLPVTGRSQKITQLTALERYIHVHLK